VSICIIVFRVIFCLSSYISIYIKLVIIFIFGYKYLYYRIITTTVSPVSFLGQKVSFSSIWMS
jgi:hypothetical protein